MTMTEQAVKLRIVCEAPPEERTETGPGKIRITGELPSLATTRVLAILEDGREVDISRHVASVSWDVHGSNAAMAHVQIYADVQLETLGLVVESDVERPTP